MNWHARTKLQKKLASFGAFFKWASLLQTSEEVGNEEKENVRFYCSKNDERLVLCSFESYNPFRAVIYRRLQFQKSFNFLIATTLRSLQFLVRNARKLVKMKLSISIMKARTLKLIRHTSLYTDCPCWFALLNPKIRSIDSF